MSQSIRTFLPVVAPPFLLALVAGGVCYVICGTSLGLYFGGLTMALILAPPFVAHQRQPLDAFLASASVIDGIGIFWLGTAIANPQATLLQWFLSYLVLLAVVLAACALVISLRTMIGPTLAAALVTILMLAHLAWPIWLSPHLSGRGGAMLVAWLTPVHPLLALNRIYLDLGMWTEQRWMYQLTVLGQDIAYRLPASVFPCVALHAAIVLIVGLPAWWWQSCASSSPTDRVAEA